jgi:hypothetical protein
MDDHQIDAFNMLANLLVYGNMINADCSYESDCEETIDRIDAIVKKMKKLVEGEKR